MNLWMRLCHFNLIFKVDWAVTFYLKLFLIGLANAAPLPHINKLWEEFVLLRVDDWEGMDGNKNLVTIAMYSY